MFMIRYAKPLLASLLGVDKPKRVRIKTFKNENGQIEYLPQACWIGNIWSDNRYSTPKVKTLMWSLYGPRGNQGINLDDVEIIGVPVPRKYLEQQKLKLDYFPFDPPK